MKTTILALIVMLVIAGRAEAGFYTGNQILSSCESGDETEQRVCEGYLGGIVDATELWVGAGLMQNLVCLPRETAIDRLRQIFIDYANENPDVLHLAASGTAIAAFMAAFPCA